MGGQGRPGRRAAHTELVAGSYFFKPNHIVVKANAPVEIMGAARKPGMAPHNLGDQGTRGGAGGWRRTSATSPGRSPLRATKPGRYEIYCSKKPPVGQSHRERGMVGTLEVVP